MIVAAVDTLIERLLKLQKNGITQFVAVCGAADLGKSTLCKTVIDELTSMGISADILSMDSYLIPRQRRNALGISGYHSEAYEWDRLYCDLTRLQFGNCIHIEEYDHKAGIANGDLREIRPAAVILIDGLHAMHPRIIAFLDLSVFVRTSDSHLKQLRLNADIEKRGLSPETALEQADKEFARYKKHIAPYEADAQIILSLADNWEYT